MQYKDASGLTGAERKSHVVVVRAGGLGDLVLLSEFVASLNEADHERVLTLICREEFAPVVECYPFPPDEVIGLPFQPYAWGEPGDELRELLELRLSELSGRRIAVLVDAALRPNWHPSFFRRR